MDRPILKNKKFKVFFWLFAFFLLVSGLLSSFFWVRFRPVLHKDLIDKNAALYHFDPLFLMALIKVESHFQKDATSQRGAVGLMQLMPDTALEMARKEGNISFKRQDLADPDVNLRLGTHYLSFLREEFGEDPVSILAAYNAGPANARSWQRMNVLTLGEIPFPETRRFVKEVLSTYQWLKKIQRIKNAV